tara:strand:+ start:1031 stop:1186 length:156 start_codon:yes stop_codon:yes gene_type:complete
MKSKHIDPTMVDLMAQFQKGMQAIVDECPHVLTKEYAQEWIDMLEKQINQN